jgi:hypothetical protein
MRAKELEGEFESIVADPQQLAPIQKRLHPRGRLSPRPENSNDHPAVGQKRVFGQIAQVSLQDVFSFSDDS